MNNKPTNNKTRPPSKCRAAIIDINIGVLIFVIHDLVVKYLSNDYSVSQLMVSRAVVSMPFLIWLLMRWRFDIATCWSAIFSPRWGWALVRGLVLALGFNIYFLSLPVLPIATALSIFLTTPLFLVLFSFLFIGDAILPRQLLALFFGFAGSLIVLQPWGSSHDIGYAGLLPLLGAMLYALGQTIARKYLQNKNATMLAFYQNIAFIIIFGAMGLFFYFYQFDSNHASLDFLTRSWTLFAPKDFLLMLGLGIGSIIGMICMARAYSTAPAGVLAPFEYCSLLIAGIAGFVIWNEVPSILGIIGAFMIFMAGLLIVRRDGKI